MKKYLFILAFSIACIGCENQNANIQKCYTMLSEAEQAQETIETIPCGIRFGMTKDEINSHLEKLSLNPDSTNVSKKDDFYYYTFKFPTGYYKALILPALPMNGKIHNVSFIFRNSMVSLPESRDESLLKDLKLEFGDLISSSCVIGDKEHLHKKYTCWAKDNLAIYFNNDSFFCGLTFANAPIDKTAHTLKFSQEITSSVNSQIKNKENSKSENQVTGADKYIETITGFTCVKATVTDNGFLIIAIDATSESGYDFLASQFLDEAKKEGVSGLKGVMIVDSQNCQFQKGAVVGKRIGKAFNK